MAIFFRHNFGGLNGLPHLRIRLLVIGLAVILLMFAALFLTFTLTRKAASSLQENAVAIGDTIILAATQPDNNPKDSASAGSLFVQKQNSSDAKSNVSTTVTINGQDVPVPENGVIHQEITSPSGNTSTVNISVNNTSSSTSNDNSSNPTLRIRSKSKSTIRIHDDSQLNDPSLGVSR